MKFRPQILAKLSVKHKGLSKHLLGLLADKLAAKVTEESEIEGAITELDDSLIPVSELAKLLQQEGDRRVAAVQKPVEADPETEEDDEKPAQPSARKGKEKGADDPLTKLMGMVQTLTGEIAAIKKGEQQKTLSQQLHERLKEKGIPAVFAKGRTVEKEEDIDAVVTEIETDHAAYKQELADQGFSQITKPLGGKQAGTDKVDPDIAAFSKKQNEKSLPTKN
ncbi:hypothetical protein EGT74_24505 [Chitinophaga lutea]|uniref:Uncharacterized protein n=1 Tax=Chitinophaga lutea TaxID=2488634 RepID=A0A3N4PDP5_9BACT|nr:hypothetical protein [Chitinophaga lutea]RPE05548.1 hypothetical protein EGT74_24505 [Chitinophaga lutea]